MKIFTFYTDSFLKRVGHKVSLETKTIIFFFVNMNWYDLFRFKSDHSYLKAIQQEWSGLNSIRIWQRRGNHWLYSTLQKWQLAILNIFEIYLTEVTSALGCVLLVLEEPVGQLMTKVQFTGMVVNLMGIHALWL